jgi:hypothetical protein
MSNTISAADNPQLVNNLVEQALSEKPKLAEPTITPPSDTTVNLPGGLVLPTGEVLRTAEVRELTGRDEEAISKAPSVGKAIMTLVDRGTVKIGNLPADETILYNLLLGDRDALLLGIYKATFGSTADIPAYCTGCNDYKTASVDIDTDIKTQLLVDPANEAIFTVEGKKGDIVVKLPTGKVQKELLENSDKSSAELSTIILEKCVISINGAPVVSKGQVQNLSIVDRRKVLEEIDDRAPGPKLQDLTVDCPDCGGKVGVPISFGTLFRF